MLRTLDIRDMLLIDRLDLTFQPGLNVLTGETGAGKSILLDALGFVLGWRGRAELVRAGASQGEVTAVFDLGPVHAARAVLEDAGIAPGDELILRRVNTADGRKTAWIDDRRVTGEVLRQVSATLVELHGQHDDRGLLDARGHRALLDAFAGLDLGGLRSLWSARRAAAARLAEQTARVAALREEEEYLRHAVDELDRLDPQEGDAARLDSARRSMQAAERVRGDIGRAMQALGPEGAEGPMRDAARWLEGAADALGDRVEPSLAALERAMTELGEAEQGVARMLDELDVDPGELETVEERLFALRGLARKHGVIEDELGALADDLRGRLADLDAGADTLGTLEAEADAAEQRYREAADDVSARRRTAAQRLDAAMRDELAPLKMERAVFRTEIAPTDAGPEGIDAVSFTVATNPGAPAGPLARIASGGELSRFLLALKVCLSRGTGGTTMIFDEIDRGVGGATADAVGRRLAALSQSAQVLVVTHSPQVAALGAHHWRVEKRVTGDVTTSAVIPLQPAQRVDEIARMVAGDRVTDEARGAARALLAG